MKNKFLLIFLLSIQCYLYAQTCEELNKAGQDYISSGKFLEAEQVFTKYISICSDISQGYSSRGNARIFLKKFQDAIDDFNKAISIDSTNFRAYSNRGTVYVLLQNGENAEKDFLKALMIKPDDVTTLNSYSAILYADGRKREALEMLDECISIDPAHAESYRTRGSIRLFENDTLGAVSDLTKAI